MTSELDRDILVTAPPDAGGVRIDRFLATALEDNAALDAPLSRTRIKALIQSGGLFEAGAPQIDPSATVRADIEYRLVLPTTRVLVLSILTSKILVELPMLRQQTMGPWQRSAC